MKRLFIIVLALTMLSTVACAAPLTDYSFGRASVDLKTFGTAAGFGATMGLGNNFALNITNTPDTQLNVLYGFGNSGSGSAVFAIYAGVQSTNGFVFENNRTTNVGAQIGAQVYGQLSNSFGLYANLQVGTPCFEAKAGGSYKINESFDANLELVYDNFYSTNNHSSESYFYPSLGVTMKF